MMKIATLAVLALVAAAGGCVTAQEQRAYDEERCRSYGFRQGSDGFARCLLDLDLDRSATLRQRFDAGFGGPFYYRGRW
jgi:hypothetical protein